MGAVGQRHPPHRPLLVRPPVALPASRSAATIEGDVIDPDRRRDGPDKDYVDGLVRYVEG